MTITEFLAVVRNATLRGTALDTQAASAFRQAIRFIERNYDLPYMRRIITADCTSEFSLTGTDARLLKTIQQLRWFDSDALRKSIVQIDPYELKSRETGVPAGYEYFTETASDGSVTITLLFDTEFEETTEVELLGYFYSNIDLTSPGNSSLWLVENAEDAVLARTMINLAPIMRDSAVLQMYQALWQESIGTLIGAVSSLEQSAR